MSKSVRMEILQILKQRNRWKKSLKETTSPVAQSPFEIKSSYSTRKHNLKYNNNFFIISICQAIIFSYFVTSLNGDILIFSPASNRSIQSYDDIELFFGTVPSKGIQGKIVLAEPEDACIPIKNVAPKGTADKWFLLVRRYPCLLEQKARNAANAGYDAIIIHSAEPYTNRRALNTDLEIVSVLISGVDGEDIKDNYLYNKGGYIARIEPSYQFPLDQYLLPFAVIIIICLFLMILFLIFQIIKCARDRRKLQRHRLSTKQLKQLLTTIYTKGSHYDTCAICLEEYIEGERLRILPCAHGYHFKCIDPWLTKSRRICPVCKGKVRVSGMSDVSDTESESDHPSTSRNNRANESTPLLRDQRSINSSRSHNSLSISIHHHQSTSITNPHHHCQVSGIENDSSSPPTSNDDHHHNNV